MPTPEPRVFEPGRDVPQAAFERLICGHPREVVCAYGSDGRQLFAPREGEADRVVLPSRGEVDLRGAVLVHNHPRFRTFSPKDIETGALRMIRSLVVVLPDRTVIRLSVTMPEEWPYEELMERHYQARGEAVRILGDPQGREEDLVAIHRDTIRRQMALFSQIGVIMEHSGMEP